MGTLVLKPDEPGQRSIPITAQECDPVVRIYQIDRSRAHIEDAEDSCLDAKLPLSVKEGFVTINGERLAEICREHTGQVQTLRELSVVSAELRPAGVGMQGSEQGAVWQPLGLQFGYGGVHGFLLRRGK